MKWRRRRFQRARKKQRLAAVVLKPFLDDMRKLREEGYIASAYNFRWNIYTDKPS
jgi:hypothetical protein